jgi:hypothetical protein
VGFGDGFWVLRSSLSSKKKKKKKSGASDYIKAACFGGMDGIITTFAVVSSVAGAHLATHVVIIMASRALLWKKKNKTEST